MNQHDYMSIERMTISDHKPVCAAFQLTVKSIDEEKRTAVYKELIGRKEPAHKECPYICCIQNERNT